MVSPYNTSGTNPSQIIKWSLPITLLVTVLGFWWHNRKKKKPYEEDQNINENQIVESNDDKKIYQNGNLIHEGLNGECKNKSNETNLTNNKLSDFIATVQRLNEIESANVELNIQPVEDKKVILNGSIGNGSVVANGKISNGNIPNGTPIQLTPTKRSAPQPCTPKTTPGVEELIIASSVKHLNSGSVLNNRDFGVKKSPTKRWSQLIEENDSNSDDDDSRFGIDKLNGVNEELQFQFEEVTSSTVTDSNTGVGGAANNRVNDNCDSTNTYSDVSSAVIEKINSSHLCNQTTQKSQLQFSTKSYSESEANAEVDKITRIGDTTSETQQRDSANHSPNTDVMLTSPCLSDVQSEGSSDSGKGCSEASRTPAGGSSVSGEIQWCSHDFVLPQHMVGRLIGKGGVFIHRVRSLTHTKMYIKRHPNSFKLKICAIEGTQADIEAALQLIRQKFPLSDYPFLTLDKVSFLSSSALCCPLRPEPFHLQLVEGINNDVSISSLTSAGHFFVQLPSHPTYQNLESLNLLMNTTYSSAQAPLLPAPVENALVAAPAMGGWFRAQILTVDTVNSTCYIKFVDYGGYMNIETCSLRQIRADFLSLPFQAIECALANIIPNNENGEWTEEARIVVHGLTSGHILQAQVYDYSCDNNQLPLIYLYMLYDTEVVLVNQELVERGFARLDQEALVYTDNNVDNTNNNVNTSTTKSTTLVSTIEEESTPTTNDVQQTHQTNKDEIKNDNNNDMDTSTEIISVDNNSTQSLSVQST